MLKKFGMVTVGVTAGLLAVAPMASASDHGDHDKRDRHHHKSHEKHHGSSHGDQNGTGNIQCSAEGDDFVANNSPSLANVGPVGSGNTGQLLSCNSFLNDVLSHNNLSVLGDNVNP